MNPPMDSIRHSRVAHRVWIALSIRDRFRAHLRVVVRMPVFSTATGCILHSLDFRFPLCLEPELFLLNVSTSHNNNPIV